MHFKSSLLPITLAGTTMATPLTVEREVGLRTTADVYSVLGLDLGEAASGTLKKSVDWRWCIANGDRVTACVGTGTGLVGVAIKTNSNANDCCYHKGRVDKTQYQIHTTGPSCHTDAQSDMIEGGLKTYFDAQGGAVCDVHCVQQSHGGGYTGYLLIAPSNMNISNVKCDSSVSLNRTACGHGGKKDAP